MFLAGAESVELFVGHALVGTQIGDLIVHTLEELDPERLLTITQAAEWLDIGSVNTLKLLVRKLGLRTNTMATG